nr:alanine racemase [Salsipaludibacter albus]
MLEVDLSALRHNLDVVRAATGDAQVCAVVKADAYGHGAAVVARTLLDAGAAWLAVALVEEGEALRAAGIEAPILLLSEPVGRGRDPRPAARRLLDAELVPSVATTSFADALAAEADERVGAHLLVDTGMARVGARTEAVGELLDHPGLHVTGAWTHLARADEDVDTTDRQLARWDAVVTQVRARVPNAVIHAANSAGTLRHPRSHFDLVRAGIVLYGLSPAPGVPATSFGLRQVLRLRTGVSFVKHVAAGTPVSYGHTWTAPVDGWLATLPIGYADGVPRIASNGIEVLLAGRRLPQVGRVTMDQTMVFCGEHRPSLGDEVVLLGGQGDGFVSVDEWAAAADTISYEIPCQLTARVPRVHLG